MTYRPLLHTSALAQALAQTLQTRLADALATVAAYYADLGEPLTLPMPVSITRGYDEAAYQLPLADYPRITIYGFTRRPTPEGSDGRSYASVAYLPIIEVLAAGASAQEAFERAARITEAVMWTILDAAPFVTHAGVFDVESIAPPVEDAAAVTRRDPQNAARVLGYMTGQQIGITLTGVVDRG